jgi:hypothetical protein
LVRIALLLGAVAAICLTGTVALARDSPDLSDLPEWARKPQTVQRKALVIGLDEYVVARPLVTPSYDAKKVAETLHDDMHFDSVDHVNAKRLSRDEMIDRIEAFGATLIPGDIALVFFSGHGVSIGGRDFLVPSNATIAWPGREPFTYVSLDFVLDTLIEKNVAVAVVILDACRTSPFVLDAPEPFYFDVGNKPAPAPPATTVATLGLVPAPAPAPAGPDSNPVASTAAGPTPLPIPTLDELGSPPPTPAADYGDGIGAATPMTGVIVGYAAAAGKPAFSLMPGDTPDDNSLFTRQLVIDLLEDDSLLNILGTTSSSVSYETKTKQVPWMEAGGTPPFALVTSDSLEKKDLARWRRLVSTTTEPTDLEQQLGKFVSLHPDSRFAQAARIRLAALKATPRAAAAQPALQPVSIDVATVGGNLIATTVQTSDQSGEVVVARATRPLQMNASPVVGWSGKLANLAKTATIQEGERLQVLEVLPDAQAAKVQTASGQIGFVRGVTISSSATIAFQTQYTPDGLDAPFDDAQRAYLEKSVTRAYRSVVIKLGPSTVKDNAAPQIVFDRGLRLKEMLVSFGYDRDRVRVDTNDQAAPDTVEIVITQDGGAA